jgi:phosphoglycerate dehydrogenase-like enzyme
MILSHLKRLPQQRQQMAARDYPASWGYSPGLRYAGDLTLGLLGLGEIARPLARYARAFEMRIRYWDRVRFPELEAEYGIEWVEWDELFRESDILSVQLALNPQTEGIIGAREIGLLKSDALFVNTARGKLVDQAALTAAIRERRIGGAAMEVFAEEPLPTNDPLLDLHDDPSYNLTLTPHSSSIAPWTWFRDSQAVWYNALRHLEGAQIQWRV